MLALNRPPAHVQICVLNLLNKLMEASFSARLYPRLHTLVQLLILFTGNKSSRLPIPYSQEASRGYTYDELRWRLSLRLLLPCICILMSRCSSVVIISDSLLWSSSRTTPVYLLYLAFFLFFSPSSPRINQVFLR